MGSPEATLIVLVHWDVMRLIRGSIACDIVVTSVPLLRRISRFRSMTCKLRVSMPLVLGTAAQPSCQKSNTKIRATMH